MELKILTICLLMPVTYANITINIVASNEAGECSVSFMGVVKNIISDQERDTFRLSDNSLKDAVREHFGARPDEAYVKSRTPWGDLYQTYTWPQVTRSLTPVSAVTLDTTFGPSIIKTQKFINNSSKSAKYMVKIFEEVQNTVKSTWEKGGELTVSQEFVYGYDIKAISVIGNTTFSYSSKWGESVSKSESVKVGYYSNSTIVLRDNVTQNVLYSVSGEMNLITETDKYLIVNEK